MTDAPPGLSLPADATCLHCGYSLLALTLPRCPECGQRFDPTDMLTFRSAASRRMSRHLRWVSLLIAVMAAKLAYGKWERWEQFPGQAMVAALAFAVALASLGEWLVGIHHTDEKRRFHRRLRFWCILVATILVFTPYQQWTCPHGAGVRIGPIAVTRIGPDGMCRNACWIGERHPISGDVSWYWAKSW